jgi:hypothetical protein
MRTNDVSSLTINDEDYQLETPANCYPLRSAKAPNQLHLLGTLSSPTSQRTDQRTNKPTDGPTDKPTDQRTGQQTIGPTDQPTDRPTDADHFIEELFSYKRSFFCFVFSPEYQLRHTNEVQHRLRERFGKFPRLPDQRNENPKSQDQKK